MLSRITGHASLGANGKGAAGAVALPVEFGSIQAQCYNAVGSIANFLTIYMYMYI